jgi:hypothetical protein
MVATGVRRRRPAFSILSRKRAACRWCRRRASSTVTYNKLKQQKGNPSIDIAWIDGGISELAAADGVVATIDPAKVANVRWADR